MIHYIAEDGERDPVGGATVSVCQIDKFISAGQIVTLSSEPSVKGAAKGVINVSIAVLGGGARREVFDTSDNLHASRQLRKWISDAQLGGRWAHQRQF